MGRPAPAIASARADDSVWCKCCIVFRRAVVLNDVCAPARAVGPPPVSAARTADEDLATRGGTVSPAVAPAPAAASQAQRGVAGPADVAAAPRGRLPPTAACAVAGRAPFGRASGGGESVGTASPAPMGICIPPSSAGRCFRIDGDRLPLSAPMDRRDPGEVA